MRHLVVMLVLGVSVLLRLDPVELVVYLDSAPKGTPTDTVVMEAACQYILAEAVPLPVPYTVRVFQRSGEGQRFVPENLPIARGLLSKCPALEPSTVRR
jgi:hypothetical protein